jgi:NADPH2 dehydrogenase
MSPFESGPASLGEALPKGEQIFSPIPKLFQPFNLGPFSLSHRIIMAPLTRMRADSSLGSVLPQFSAKYYADRASMSGTFVISEGTIIAPYATGRRTVPGIWSREQVKRWREVSFPLCLASG